VSCFYFNKIKGEKEMNFAQAMTKETQKKLTENGAVAYSTTNTALLDLFATIGALRSRSEEEIANKFAAAFAEDALLATKMLFYSRDIRNGGLGERRTFRICLSWLSENYPDIVRKNLMNVVFFGRFDDLYCLFDTPNQKNKKDVIDVINDIIVKDIEEASAKRPISLMAKWLPSENTSSKKTRRYASIIRKGLGLKPRTYRVLLSRLREYLKVTERQMSLNQWSEINYPAVPSYAMLRYRNVFPRRDGERFRIYLDSLKSGEKKINASTLFPYDLVHNYIQESYWSPSTKIDTVIEEQWKALPNYVNGENNFVVMADVSGSMYGRPIETSIGLATYFAQRNNGAYKNLYMTFTDNPHFVSLEDCKTFREAINKTINTDMGYSTNLKAAFDYILSTAKKNNISAEELPKALVVISDMEIDPYFPCEASYQGYRRNLDFVETVRKDFKAAGYRLPKLVLWNVDARKDTFLSQDENVLFVGGQSPSVFKNLCGALEGKTAYDFMCEILNNKVYDSVVI
jgi:hypothetical protein